MLADNNRKQTYLEDRDLWKAFKSGDQHAYADIYQFHADSLFKSGMHLCGDADMVEDMIHDIFIEIWEKRNRLAQVTSIRLYLKFSLRRRILRNLKKNSLSQSEEVLHQNAFKFSMQAEALINENDHSQQKESELLLALNDLSSRQREVIYLRFYQDMTYEEIADHLSLDISYIYNVTSRAYAKIRSSLCSIFLSLIFFEFFV
jgi:RNA polymerase sigma factor (sigma-70 family)